MFEFGAGARLLDVQSKSGSTALHMATEQKKMDVCTLLLEAGADRTLKDEDGKTPQDLCGKDKEMLELFKVEGKGWGKKGTVGQTLTPRPRREGQEGGFVGSGAHAQVAPTGAFVRGEPSEGGGRREAPEGAPRMHSPVPSPRVAGQGAAALVDRQRALPDAVRPSQVVRRGQGRENHPIRRCLSPAWCRVVGASIESDVMRQQLAARRCRILRTKQHTPGMRCARKRRE